MKRVSFGTRHGKQAVVSPVLERAGFEVSVVDLDTDRFGTFSGLVPRHGSQLDTAIAKAQASAEMGATRIGVASEGAFGPDPVLGVIPIDIELVVLVDAERIHPVVGQYATHTTNFAHAHVASIEEARAFISRSVPVDHGLIAVTDDGVMELTDAQHQISELLAASGPIRLETDMRAHRNPTRMKAIHHAAIDLASMLAVQCTACGGLGAACAHAQAGLPCAQCSTPTSRVKVITATCSWCDASIELRPRHGLSVSDPSECFVCNP